MQGTLPFWNIKKMIGLKFYLILLTYSSPRLLFPFPCHFPAGWFINKNCELCCVQAYRSSLAGTVGWVVQRVKIKKFDFLIATFNFLCVFVCRKRICKKFFKKQQSSFVGFDLKYTKEILKITSATKGRPISSGRVNFKAARRGGGGNLIPSPQCIVKCPAMCT